MVDTEDTRSIKQPSELIFFGFALTECTVQLDPDSARYLRAVHRTALELAIQNRFGVEIGGFWLTREQIKQLRSLAEYYPLDEAPLVERAIKAFLKAQLAGINPRGGC